MKTMTYVRAMVAVLVTSVGALAGDLPPVTYQGVVELNGAPVTGVADLQFKLYTAQTGGTMLLMHEAAGVEVDEGRFTVGLPFGEELDGFNRWIEIAVRFPSNVGDYVVLEPRQQLTCAPFAATSVWSGLAEQAVTASYANAPWTTTSGVLHYNGGRVGVGTNTGVQQLALTEGLQIDTDDTATLSVMQPNLEFPGIRFGSNVSVRGIGSSSLFGYNPEGLDFFTGGLRRMSVWSDGRITMGNVAPGMQVMIGSNDGNALGLQSSSTMYTVFSIVNTSSGGRNYSLISTGQSYFGGSGNFVIRDVAAGEDRFVIGPNGYMGFNRLGSSHPLTVGYNSGNGNGAHLTAGGMWMNGSDVNSKEGFEPVDPIEVLEQVASLPVLRWRYKGEGEDVQHMGPTAQDFRATFGLGESEKHIGTVDADGVALAAIQGLCKLLEERDARIDELTARLERLESALAERAENAVE